MLALGASDWHLAQNKPSIVLVIFILGLFWSKVEKAERELNAELLAK